MVACEGHGNDLTGCFIGCTLGASDGAPALYTYLTPEKLVEFGAYNSYRCAAANHEYCLCASPSPPPPPPPVRKDETEWIYAGSGVPSDAYGHATAFYKHVATDVAMPTDFQSDAIEYACPGEETGSLECARHCSEELGNNLVAFQVTGVLAPPPPPSYNPPPPSPPPPLPLPPYGEQFNGASDACTNAGLYHGAECRDGGVGSVYPHYCDYAHRHVFAFNPRCNATLAKRTTSPARVTPPSVRDTKCGARPYHNNGEIIGDDSCIYAHNGQCEDGGVGSSFYTDVDVNGFEYQAAACGYATDKTDCEPIGGLRTLQSLGPLSYAFPGQPHPPMPIPPPSPPSSPPPPPPAYTFASCVDTCTYLTQCSDGGAGAHLVVSNGVREFKCNYGTQVRHPEPLRPPSPLSIPSSMAHV